MKRLLAFDLDGTLLTRNSSFAFCFYLYKKKILSRRALIYCFRSYFFHRYLGLSLYQLHRNVFDYVLKGKRVSLFEKYLEPFLDEKLPSMLNLSVYNRLKDFKKQSIILSNAPEFIVKAIAVRLGVEHFLGTKYSIDQEGLLHDIAEFVDGDVKGTIIKKAACQTAAYSDSFLDLSFLQAADCAIAVRPDRRLRAVAKRQGWEILL